MAVEELLAALLQASGHVLAADIIGHRHASQHGALHG